MKPNLKLTISEHKEALASLDNMIEGIEELTDNIITRLRKGGTLYWMGNGGSAADSQHYAAELMVRYSRNRNPIKSIALTTDTSLITAHTNDFEYDSVFARQVEALVEEKDIVCGISTSGNSINVFNALKVAKDRNTLTFGLLGNDGGAIKDVVDHALIVDSEITARIQEIHLIIGHYICDKIEFSFVE